MSNINNALSCLFMPSVISDLFKNNKSERIIKIFAESNLLKTLDTNLLFKDFFEYSYKYLLKNYRNEYVFKNAIAEKILIGRHSINSSSLFTEFRVATSKADLVIFNGTSHVYEIKTAFDNFDRLLSQIESYKKVFEYVNVVTVESKVNTLISLVDDDVGILILTDKYTIRQLRKPKSGLNHLEQKAIFDILRRNEYIKIIKHFGFTIPKVPNTKIYSICQEIFEKLPINKVHKEMLKILKERRSHKEMGDFILNIPNSLKVAALEANLSKKQQADFLVLLNQNISEIFSKKDSHVSSVFKR